MHLRLGDVLDLPYLVMSFNFFKICHERLSLTETDALPTRSVQPESQLSFDTFDPKGRKKCKYRMLETGDLADPES